MSESTFASAFVEAEYQEQAQQDMGVGYFTAPLSPTGEAPSTHYWSTGYWLNTELDFIVNEATWPKTVKFGDAQAALASMGLMPVVEEPVEE
jgi:hypothetical protein